MSTLLTGFALLLGWFAPAPVAPPLPSSDAAVVAAALQRAAMLPASPRRIPIMIVPHHLVAAEAIAQTFARVRGQDIDRVIIVSPDHFDRCPTTLCASETGMRVGAKVVQADRAAVRQLLLAPKTSRVRGLMREEHGIRALVPFVADTLPNARIVPLVVAQSHAWREEADALAALLARQMDPQTLLVFSTDASHTLPLEAANAADQRTLTALLSADRAALMRAATPTETDCPACLWLATELALTQRAFLPTVVAHTNSATLLGDPAAPDTTSHLALTYTAGDAPGGLPVALAGDVTVARGIPSASLDPAVAAFWDAATVRIANLEGPARSTCPPTRGYQFCNALHSIQALPHPPTHWGIANNHDADLPGGAAATLEALDASGLAGTASSFTTVDRTRVLAVTALRNSIAGAPDPALELAAALALLRADPHPDLLTIVVLHAGVEYAPLPEEATTALGEAFLAAGADVVGITHSHVPGDVQFLENGIIARGLGNFFFDQFAAHATRTSLVLRVGKDADGALGIASAIGPVSRE